MPMPGLTDAPSEMNSCNLFFINGAWVEPSGTEVQTIIDPSTESPIGTVSLGTDADIGKAAVAAKVAFETFAKSTVEDRIQILRRLEKEYAKRFDEIVEAITFEMGAPLELSKGIQAPTGVLHIQSTLALLSDFSFEEVRGSTCVVKEPIGVCGLITPWNWPVNQFACKAFPAIAAGCSLIWKPSEYSPISATILAEIFAAADLPPGVFNMVHGTGEIAGRSLAKHPMVDMISFTGSTRAGIDISKVAADSIKRVTTELGGKSANIVLDDESFEEGVEAGVSLVLINSGQSCAAPTRLLVPRWRLSDAEVIAARVAEAALVGDPRNPDVTMGPVANLQQFTKTQDMIERAIKDGAKLLTGGLGRPDNLSRGFFVKPTIFSEVDNRHMIAREEIFGPVLCITPYDNLDHAISLANDSDYGLSGYVGAFDHETAISIARRLRTGSVFVNGAAIDPMAPLGGYKKSGNGREWGVEGLLEYLETKSIVGYSPATDGLSISLT